MKRWSRWLLMALCLATFTAIAVTLERWSPLDEAVSAALVAWRTPFGNAFFTGCTWLASSMGLAAGSVLLVVFLRKKEYCVPLLCNLVVVTLFNLGLKGVFQRARPAAAFRMAADGGFSFPSGHAMAATAFYGFLVFLCWQTVPDRRKRLWATAGLAAIIALVCASRVYLGMHYLSDVLAGCLLSSAYLVAYCSLTARYLRQGEGQYLRAVPAPKTGNLLHSFGHAFDGLSAALRTERNLIIHFTVMTLVILFGLTVGLSAGEWVACVVLFGLVLATELLNTALEVTLDICMPEEDPRVKLAKDTAAAAVLVCALAAAVAGLIIFAPKLIVLLGQL